MWLRFHVAMVMVEASAAALIQPQAWELPYGVGTALKRKRERKKKFWLLKQRGYGLALDIEKMLENPELLFQELKAGTS